MNKTEVLALKCKRVAGHNIKCYQILCELIDAGREDLLDEIIKAMNVNCRVLSPAQIVKTYEACGGKQGFIKRCNTIWNKKTYATYKKEYEYEEEFKRYSCGEQKYHPDGSKFEHGEEINYG